MDDRPDRVGRVLGSEHASTSAFRVVRPSVVSVSSMSVKTPMMLLRSARGQWVRSSMVGCD